MEDLVYVVIESELGYEDDISVFKDHKKACKYIKSRLQYQGVEADEVIRKYFKGKQHSSYSVDEYTITLLEKELF